MKKLIKNTIKQEKEKVFNSLNYQNLKIEERLQILHIVKNWINEEITKQLNNKIYKDTTTIFINQLNKKQCKKTKI